MCLLFLDDEQLQDLCPLMAHRFSKDGEEKARDDTAFFGLRNLHVFRTKLFLCGLFYSASF